MGKMKIAEDGQNKNKEKQEKAHKMEAAKVHLSGLQGGQRVKMVGAEEPVATEVNAEGEVVKKSNRKIVEKIRGKKYVESKKKFDNTKTYSTAEAIKLVKETSYSKFDGTVELHIIVKKAGISAQVALPHQAGKTKKIEIASDETIEKLKTGKIDFDILVATTEMMPKLVPFARLLGPKGLMPNPKNGTLVPDEKKAKAFSTGSVLLKTEKEAPLVHTVIGKVSQDTKELVENLEAIFKAFGGGKQIDKAYIKATMGPSVKVKV
ncbi:MAG: 50S ribosomal protein L1 [Candidatus Woesebacteria bacterium]|nr:50S ribosomal protein L1 [Candidatus Woesebacteria bacterium]